MRQLNTAPELVRASEVEIDRFGVGARLVLYGNGRPEYIVRVLEPAAGLVLLDEVGKTGLEQVESVVGTIGSKILTGEVSAGQEAPVRLGRIALNKEMVIKPIRQEKIIASGRVISAVVAPRPLV